ncbi:hypothetical protein GWK47_009196 [Chionoecetes opilio]|uniref:Uncharacterized protein n=1 Tax=Chionoecetes opilio TaxID=41210 RepID=A0A8J4XYV6_CHIOP|nr:hypothetical protein GWK47_009196 [Chionoecetes opilio]
MSTDKLWLVGAPATHERHRVVSRSQADPWRVLCVFAVPRKANPLRDLAFSSSQQHSIVQHHYSKANNSDIDPCGYPQERRRPLHEEYNGLKKSQIPDNRAS